MSALRTAAFFFVLTGAGCSAFLRTGFVEERPAGRTLVLPAQAGQHEAGRGNTKTFEPTFVVLKGGSVVELSIVLKPHVRALEGYLPTHCDRVVVSSTATDGVSSAVRYETHGGGHELFVARFAPSDLKPFATEDGGRITLCDYSYRFGGNGLAALLR